MAWMTNFFFCFEVLRSTMLRKHMSSPVDIDTEQALRFTKRVKQNPEISYRSVEVVVVT